MIFGLRDCITDFYMKPLYKKLINFLRKEWFLLVILSVIAVIIFVYEHFNR